MPSATDATGTDLDAWILGRRGPKNRVDPSRPYAFLVEPEHAINGHVEETATVFLTNRECPFRCLMCDLWKNTTDEPVERGSIAGQIRHALDRLPPARHIKLYNSGNFFDPGAIPEEDYREIADAVSGFDTVIVESHPRLIGRRCMAFREMLDAKMHVAMGLETVHPEVLVRLNKRMTLEEFERSTHLLRKNGVQVRAFVLLRPPYLSDAEGVMWAKRSIDFAFDVGVECCAVIPTRAGNGAMEELAARGDFAPPTLDSVEEVFDYGLGKRCGRVFVDLWDIRESTEGAADAAARVERLNRMNLTQCVEPRHIPVRQ